MNLTFGLFNTTMSLNLLKQSDLPSIFTFISFSIYRKDKKRLDIISIEWFFRYYYVKIMNRRFKFFEKANNE